MLWATSQHYLAGQVHNGGPNTAGELCMSLLSDVQDGMANAGVRLDIIDTESGEVFGSVQLSERARIELAEVLQPPREHLRIDKRSPAFECLQRAVQTAVSSIDIMRRRDGIAVKTDARTWSPTMATTKTVLDEPAQPTIEVTT